MASPDPSGLPEAGGDALRHLPLPLRLQLPRRVQRSDGPEEIVFEGTLGELAHALRSRRLPPREVDLLRVVREVLVRFDAFAAVDLDLATEALPSAAAVVELKARLLLPRPALEAEGAEDEVREEAIAAVALLEALEEAIAELRERRERRRHRLPASAPAPSYPRRPRPLGIPLQHLADLATRLRPSAYFEMVRDRLTIAGAINALLRLLRPGERQPLDDLAEDAQWSTRTVYFAGALELVRDGRAKLHQQRPFAPIDVERPQR